MPKILAFPGCCTARILTGFGGTETAEYAYRPDNNRLKEGELTEYLKKQIPFLKNSGSVAIVFATTNSDQKQAMKELKEFGFIPTPAVKKLQHRDKDLIGWHFLVGDEAGKEIVAKKEEAVAPPIVELQVGDRVYIRKGLQFDEEEHNQVGYDGVNMDLQRGRVGRIDAILPIGDGELAYQVYCAGFSYYWPERFLIKRN